MMAHHADRNNLYCGTHRRSTKRQQHPPARRRIGASAVTAEAATAAAATHMRPDEAQIVVVGDAEAIGPPLEELGLAAVEVVGTE